MRGGAPGPEPSRGPSPDPACGGATLSPQAGRGARPVGSLACGRMVVPVSAKGFTKLYRATEPSRRAQNGRRFRLLPASGEKVPEGRMRGGAAAS